MKIGRTSLDWIVLNGTVLIQAIGYDVRVCFIFLWLNLLLIKKNIKMIGILSKLTISKLSMSTSGRMARRSNSVFIQLKIGNVNEKDQHQPEISAVLSFGFTRYLVRENKKTYWKSQTKSAHLIYHMIAPLKVLMMGAILFYPFNFICFS